MKEENLENFKDSLLIKLTLSLFIILRESNR